MIQKRTVLSLFLVGLLVTMAGCSSVIPGQDEKTVYDSMPEDVNMVAQMDLVGLAEDQTTKDVVEGVGTEFGSEEGFYEEELQKTINDMDSDLNENLESSEFSVRDVNNVYVFGDVNMDVEEVDAEETLEEEEVGIFVEIDTEEEQDMATILTELEENDETVEFSETDYNDYVIFTDESSSSEEKLHMTVLSDGQIAASNDMAYLKTIIDTHNGENPSMDKEMIPETPEDTYVSVSASEVSDSFGQMQDDLSEIKESPMYDELTDEEKEQLDTIEESPAPKSVSLAYYTDEDADEMTLHIEANFDTEDAASEWQRIFEQDDENVNVDVSLDTTTVTATYTMTSDVVVEETTKAIKQYQEAMYSGPTVEEPVEELPGADTSVSFSEETSSEISVTVDSISEDSYISVQSSSDVMVTGPAQVDWAHADSEGQTVTVSGAESGDVIQVMLVDGPGGQGTLVDYYTVR